MKNHWSCNTPGNFWLIQPNPPEDLWREAFRLALPVLGLNTLPDNIATALALTLGEQQFGSNHFQLSQARRFYYQIKLYLPRALINLLKSVNARTVHKEFILNWPIEDRYVRFLWEIMRQVMIIQGQSMVSFRCFWPRGLRFALVLTHDIDTAEGQAKVRKVADLEEKFGLRSSFNFVPDRYPIDWELIGELQQRGFEIGVHGLKHDGKLYHSKTTFMKRANIINHHLEDFGVSGFRSPLMHRNPDWLQALHIEYDLSFFDTDPYEPMPGGCMSIWPFIIGNFVELPYTLLQDCTLGYVLGERTPRLWLKKLEFIEKNYGLALLNTHPDYLKDQEIWDIYTAFLNTIVDRNDYWHALPSEVARWWRIRAETPFGQEPPDMILGTLILKNGRLALSLPGDTSPKRLQPDYLAN